MRRTGALLGCFMLALATGCTPNVPPDDTPAETLTIFAAASLKTSFTTLADEFAAANPGVAVNLNFDGSPALLDQLAAGAPADVLATADRATMDSAITRQLVGPATAFATNTLALIVEPGNPAHITGLDDSLSGAKLVVCEPRVPCGAATLKLADQLGVQLAPVSEESSVTGVRTKVESGQADVGVVYVTDAAEAAGRLESVPIQDSEQVRNEYLISTTQSAKAPAPADRFISFVVGDQGQRTLAQAGFGSVR